MAVYVGTNVASQGAQRYLGMTQSKLQQNLFHLSSGSRITFAGDDAAGLGISESLKAQIRANAQAERNANDGLSLTQTADGALDSIAGLLQRMRELSVQAANGTMDTNARSYTNSEFVQLRSEIDRIANATDFNGTYLLQGGMSAGLTMQVGINNSTNDQISVTIADTRTSAIGSGGSSTQFLSATTIDTVSNAQTAMATVDTAIVNVSSRRASVGSAQNRISVTISNLSNIRVQLSAANSRIRDVDVAFETAELTKNNILLQSATAMLAQANQLPAQALALLGRG